MARWGFGCIVLSLPRPRPRPEPRPGPLALPLPRCARLIAPCSMRRHSHWCKEKKKGQAWSSAAGATAMANEERSEGTRTPGQSHRGPGPFACEKHDTHSSCLNDPIRKPDFVRAVSPLSRVLHRTPVSLPVSFLLSVSMQLKLMMREQLKVFFTKHLTIRESVKIVSSLTAHQSRQNQH